MALQLLKVADPGSTPTVPPIIQRFWLGCFENRSKGDCSWTLKCSRMKNKLVIRRDVRVFVKWNVSTLPVFVFMLSDHQSKQL